MKRMHRFFILPSLLTLAAPRLSGSEQDLRVERLFHDAISVQIPNTWTVSRRGKATLIGPPGGPSVSVAYVEWTDQRRKEFIVRHITEAIALVTKRLAEKLEFDFAALRADVHTVAADYQLPP